VAEANHDEERKLNGTGDRNIDFTELAVLKSKVHRSSLGAWTAGVVGGLVAVALAYLAAPQPANPLVLHQFPIEPVLTLTAGALAAGIPAQRLRARPSLVLGLGLAGALLCIGVVALVFMIGIEPTYLNPYFVRMPWAVLRALGAAIVSVVAAATISTSVAQRV
jgi:hypothetical protein